MVYQEYIKDRNHVHMNATCWVTLSGFVQYLGRTGKCRIEETPKGWYLEYIEHDPEMAARQVSGRRRW
jgi:DNA/RNA-binding protein KIN17